MEFTFSYDPIVVASKNLFLFADETSRLLLNGAKLHATSVGLELSKGKLLVKNYATLSSEVKKIDDDIIDEGITLGNGVDDMACKIYSGATLNLTGGSLIYNNLLDSSWSMLDSLSALHLISDSRLVLQESMNLGSGIIKIGSQAYTVKSAGKSLVGSRFMVK